MLRIFESIINCVMNCKEPYFFYLSSKERQITLTAWNYRTSKTLGLTLTVDQTHSALCRYATILKIKTKQNKKI